MRITRKDWTNFMSSEDELRWAKDLSDFAKAVHRQNTILAKLLKK